MNREVLVLVRVAVFIVELIHSPRVNKEDDKEADDRALLSHPKAEWGSAHVTSIGI